MSQNKDTAKTAVNTTLTTTQLKNVGVAAVDAYLALLDMQGKHPHIDALITAIRANVGHVIG